jgi:hypothetical protein
MENIRKIIRNIIRESFLISEGATDILYHFTYLGSVLNILKSNKISLTNAVGSKADLDVNRGKFFFMSLTRSKSSGYKKGDIKIVFDGKKLSSRYKIIPVDYWQWSKKREDWNDNQSYINALSSEQEDRLISNNAEIDNALSYIKELHIFVDLSYNKVNQYKEIVSICSQAGIGVYFYQNQKDWFLQDGRKSLTIDQVEKLSPEPDESNTDDFSSPERFDYDTASLIAYNSPENYKKITEYLGDQEKIEKFNTVLKTRTENNYKFGAFYFEDGLYYLKSSIHNIRANPNKNARFLLKILADDLNRLKVKDLKSYIEKKSMIGRKSIEDLKKEYYNYLINTMDSYYGEVIESYLWGKWIEIDGQYYNNLYDSPQVMEFINGYIRKIKEYLKDKILNSKDLDIFKHNYVLDREYIKKAIDIDNLDISGKVNITDEYFSNTDYLNDTLKDLIKRVIIEIDNTYYDKGKELYVEYVK